MSSISNQMEQECRRRHYSISNSDSGPSVSSPNSAHSYLASPPHPPPIPRKNLLNIYKKFDDPPQFWGDELHSCQLAQNRDSARLESEYHIYGLDFHICHTPVPRFEEYILSAHHNRFFIWCPYNTDHPLQYIRTPWSLRGLLSALNDPNEELVTQPIEVWDSTPPTPEDIKPWPLASLPHGWTDSHLSVMCDYRASNFRDFDIHRRHPIIYYPSVSGDEDASLFERDGALYLYKP